MAPKGFASVNRSHVCLSCHSESDYFVDLPANNLWTGKCFATMGVNSQWLNAFQPSIGPDFCN